eukprot:scaffold63048_cov52-Phaeocystis_antarctica.AAC.1
MLVGSDGTSLRLRTRRSLQEARDHHVKVFVLFLFWFIGLHSRPRRGTHCPIADSDRSGRWGAPKFTIGHHPAASGSRKRPDGEFPGPFTRRLPGKL